MFISTKTWFFRLWEMSELSETFFVAASTDLERAEIMMKRIRGATGGGRGLQSRGRSESVSDCGAAAFPRGCRPLEDLVQAVADRITEMAMMALASKPISLKRERRCKCSEQTKTESN